MRLTDKEREILACVELRADVAIEQIKKETGYQEHTIRYHLHTLESRGTITRRPAINMSAAGYVGVALYFSPSPDATISFDQLRKHLRNVRDITWASEFFGDYHFGISFTVMNMLHVETALQKLAATFPNLFNEKVVVTKFRAMRFPRRYLCGKKFSTPPISFAPGAVPAPLDDTDKKIISALAHESYRSRRELGQKMGMPLSTLDGRIKRLEEKGVLCGYVYDINPSHLGVQTYTLLISCRGLTSALSKRLQTFAQEHSNITALFACLGSWDFELNIEAQHAEQARTIVEELYAEFRSDINSIKLLNKAPDLKYTRVPF